MIFAAAGALSVGVELGIDVISGEGSVSEGVARLAYCAPIALFLLGTLVLVAWKQVPPILKIISLVLTGVFVAVSALPLPLPYFVIAPTPCCGVVCGGACQGGCGRLV